MFIAGIQLNYHLDFLTSTFISEPSSNIESKLNPSFHLQDFDLVPVLILKEWSDFWWGQNVTRGTRLEGLGVSYRRQSRKRNKIHSVLNEISWIEGQWEWSQGRIKKGGFILIQVEDADGVQGQCSKTCNSQKEPLFSQDMWVYWEVDGWWRAGSCFHWC